MTSSPRPIGDIASFHAHIYFDPSTTRTMAEQLRSWIAERFVVRMGRWHDAPLGPHDRAMYQVAFEPETFASFVSFLMLNHGSLSILIHPNTVNPKRDHLDHALWIGERLAIRSDVLPDESIPDPAGEPNTVPTIHP